MFGILAVALSLLFVAFEIQQSNRIARISTELEISNLYASLNEIQMTDPEFRDFLINLPYSLAEMTPNQRLGAIAYGHRLINTYQPAITAYENGLLTQSRYEAVLSSLRNGMEMPSTYAIWEELVRIHPEYSSDTLFIYVNKLLNEQRVQ